MKEPAKVIQIILNYILSPAVIIYTIILYIYFLKILFVWELPKGGVAWMVMGFISVAIAGRMSQTILSRRYYDLFYRHLTLISIPPLILYWVGIIFRIQNYSITESRIYVILAGILMTMFMLFLHKKRTLRYQMMAIISGALIVLFTYIPGISAKSLGLYFQKQRLNEFITELKLINNDTGKLLKGLDISTINKDSLESEKYREFCSVVEYVKNEIGDYKFLEKYGCWNFRQDDFSFGNIDYDYYGETYSIKEPVNVGEYDILLPSGYDIEYSNGIVQIERKSDNGVVVRYPINNIYKKNHAYNENPQMLLTYKNDTMMLVLDEFWTRGDSISGVGYKFWLFRKE